MFYSWEIEYANKFKKRIGTFGINGCEVIIWNEWVGKRIKR